MSIVHKQFANYEILCLLKCVEERFLMIPSMETNSVLETLKRIISEELIKIKDQGPKAFFSLLKYLQDWMMLE